MTEKPIGHCTLEVLAVLHHVIPGEDRIPIYTAPPAAQRKPLTATTILNLMPSSIPADHDGALMEFARGVEAAHDIKERNT
jgi:hypothetical protein